MVDGGILNPLPLNRVKRQRGDLLVAMNISGKDHMAVKKQQTQSALSKATELMKKKGINIPSQLQGLTMRLEKKQVEQSVNLTNSVNYITLVDRMLDMQIQQNTQLALQLTPPDILAEMPQYAFTTFDFDKAETIMEQGRLLMREAIDRYEKQLTSFLING